MTITTFEGPPTVADQPSEVQRPSSGQAPPRVGVPALIWPDVEEDDAPGAPVGWLSRFAVAKRLGGW